MQTLLATDMQREVLSRLNRIRPFEFNTYGSNRLFIEWKQYHERVVTDFPLFGRLDIPAGKYDFGRYRVGLSTGVQRPLSISLEFEDGGFFGGNRRETSLDFQWRQSAHFFVGLASVKTS